jgi:sarcosine oxidase subunit alpha
MDRRIVRERGEPVAVEFEGEDVRAFGGEPLAVALHASGVQVLSRSIKYHRPRAFFCLAGHCGACLMRIDGLPNMKACQTPCHDGMVAYGQNAFPASDLDVLGAVDWMFPKGMDHHTLMTGSKLVNTVMQKVVRQLSGLGTLPDAPPASLPEVAQRHVDVLVVGGGPAGLAAATAAARAGARTMCVDEQDEPGGSLLAWPGGLEDAKRRARDAREAGVEIVSRATALAWFPEDDGGVLAVATPDRLMRLRARRYVYATGGYDVNLPFEDNDRPGVFAARAVGRLLVRHGVLAGRRVLLAGGGDYPRALAGLLRDAKVDVIEPDGEVVRARGTPWIKGADVQRSGEKKARRVECDAIAVAATPAPASEAPRSHGATVRLSAEHGGFAVVVDDAGRTSVPGVLACGDVTGYLGPARAAEHGARVGREAAQS